jgi:hypothetical protein
MHHEILRKTKYKMDLFCWLGIHNWYRGNFSHPVWGRYERHCLDCDKRQYCKQNKWITFVESVKHWKYDKNINNLLPRSKH